MRKVKDGEDIRKWRKELKISLRELGNKAVIAKTHIWSIEDGRVQQRRGTLEKIQSALEYYKGKKDLVNKQTGYIENSNLKAQYKSEAIRKFVYLLTSGNKKSSVSEDEIIAAVLGYTEGLNRITEDTGVTDDKVIQLMVEAYYVYLHDINCKNWVLEVL